MFPFQMFSKTFISGEGTITNITHDFFNSKLQIQIFSITGQLIFFEKINEENTTIKLGSINPGVYILKIRADEENIKTEKLIIK